MLRDLLLTFHILGVIAWLGFGIYELFLTHEIRKAKNTPLEVPLLRIYGRYAGLVALATFVVAIAGGFMASLLGWGYFKHLWLGIKQIIMLAILLDIAYMIPTFMRTAKAINELPDSGGPSLDLVRSLLEKVERHVIPMRVGAFIAVLLAVWRPGA